MPDWTAKYERIGKLNGKMLISTAIEGMDVYADNEDVCNKVLTYLQAVNDVLNGTPFKIAYRTRNEVLTLCGKQLALQHG